ncbi:MAG: flippase-like domain-containing protein [Flavobacteriales bacterium]|nr:flippase-like domain-containing protein [Flavobacteriales bacterium]
MSMRSSLFRITVQASLFILIIWVLTSKLNMDSIVPAIQSFSFFPIAVATLLMLVRYALLGTRWWLSITNNRPPLFWSIQTEWHILFLEFVIPFPDAEDIFRILLLKFRNVTDGSAIRSVIRMRLAGVAVLLCLLLLFFISWGQAVIGQKSTALYSVVALFILFLLPFTDFFVRNALRLVKHVPKIGQPLAKRLTDALEEPQKSGLMTVLFLVSLLQSVVQAAVIFVLLSKTSQSIPFLDILCLVPLLNLSFILPLSIQGFGLPETCLIFMLPFFGVPLEEATAVALVHLLIYSTMIFMGACLFFINSELTLKGLRNMFRKPGRFPDAK